MKTMERSALRVLIAKQGVTDVILTLPYERRSGPENNLRQDRTTDKVLTFDIFTNASRCKGSTLRRLQYLSNMIVVKGINIQLRESSDKQTKTNDSHQPGPNSTAYKLSQGRQSEYPVQRPCFQSIDHKQHFHRLCNGA